MFVGIDKMNKLLYKILYMSKPYWYMFSLHEIHII